jgi:ribosomal protein S18 acetylase RimI-like enzyme
LLEERRSVGTGENVRVRFARSDDLDWCAAEDALVAKEIIRRKVEAEEILLAEVGGRIVGYLRLEYLWSKVPFIGLIVVREEHRREGIGREILKFLESLLRAKRQRLLLSSSMADNVAAQAWHRSLGFEECGILAGINEGGVGEVFFRKRLTRSLEGNGQQSEIRPG